MQLTKTKTNKTIRREYLSAYDYVKSYYHNVHIHNNEIKLDINYSQLWKRIDELKSVTDEIFLTSFSTDAYYMIYNEKTMTCAGLNEYPINGNIMINGSRKPYASRIKYSESINIPYVKQATCKSVKSRHWGNKLEYNYTSEYIDDIESFKFLEVRFGEIVPITRLKIFDYYSDSTVKDYYLSYLQEGIWVNTKIYSQDEVIFDTPINTRTIRVYPLKYVKLPNIHFQFYSSKSLYLDRTDCDKKSTTYVERRDNGINSLFIKKAAPDKIRYEFNKLPKPLARVHADFSREKSCKCKPRVKTCKKCTNYGTKKTKPNRESLRKLTTKQLLDRELDRELDTSLDID